MRQSLRSKGWNILNYPGESIRGTSPLILNSFPKLIHITYNANNFLTQVVFHLSVAYESKREQQLSEGVLGDDIANMTATPT